jgi:hypothetical protein
MLRKQGVAELACIVVCLLAALSSANGQNSAPCSQSVGFATPKWAEAQAAHRPIEVLTANSVGWLGINHVNMSHEVVDRKFSSLLPWANPQYVQIYPFPHALETIPNRNPTFYLHVADTIDPVDKLIPGITLARMQVKGDQRLLKVTSGYFTWSAQRKVRTDGVAPVRIRTLRDDFLEISVPNPLQNGEYILLLNQSAGEGFEFRIDCK